MTEAPLSAVPHESTTRHMALIAAFAAVYIIWGSTYLAIRYAIEDIPPFLMAGSRFLIAGGIVYALSRLLGESRPSPKQWRSASIVGILLLLGGNGGVVFAQQTVPSGLTALVVAMTPVWFVLFDWLQRGRVARPGRQILAGLLVGMVGMALLAAPGLGGAGSIPTVGLVVLVLAGVSWAAGSIYSRQAEHPASPMIATGMQMLAGGAALMILATLHGDLARVDLPAVSWQAWVSYLYLIVFGSIIAFSAYVWLLKVSTPAKVATYAYVNPVVAVLLGWLVAGETMSWRAVIAAALIIAAVVIITTYRNRPVATQSAPRPQSPSEAKVLAKAA
jgi:drug/metabolite transporter (DMT)-like permease